jgi:ElaB/YqjD/DUF883 family membrane-anchored ribosome-binding protein
MERDDRGVSGGMGEVHSHLSQPAKTVGGPGAMSSGAGGEHDQSEGVRDRAGAMVEDAREHASEAIDHARDRAGELRHEAEERIGQAREKAGDALHRAGEELDDRTGVVTLIRDNPLPALGVAFAVGYLSAGSRAGKRGRMMNAATSQLRGAILGGVSAALAREFRGLMAEQGGSLAAIFGDDDGDNEGSQSSRRGAVAGSR